jgi:RNA polymerase sigma-B factor
VEVFVVLLDWLTPETLSEAAIDGLNRRDATALLVGSVHRASGEERSRLEEQVVQLNMSVARDLARRYRGRGVPLEDLEQVAYLGLVKAVKAFDPDKTNDFLSFAVPTIRGELRRYFRDFGWVVRPPRAIQELQARITGAESELCQLLGRSPRPSEMASRLDVELNQVLDALGANGCFAPSSLDYPDGDDGDVGIGLRLGKDDPGFARAEARAALQTIMRGLDERERMIIEMRFFRGCTQAEIGKEVGVTQMQVSRLIAGLLARFREQIGQTAA